MSFFDSEPNHTTSGVVDDEPDNLINIPEDPLTDSDSGEDADESLSQNQAKGTGGRGLSRAQIRRIASKANEVVEADSRTTKIAAMLVSSSADLVALTTAIMSADRSTAQPIVDLNKISEASQMEMALYTNALGRSRMKALWSLLVELGADLKTNMPAGDVQAAIEIAKAVDALGDPERSDLAAVVALLKKS